MRPRPPFGLTDTIASAFAPAPEVLEWALATFIAEDATLLNEEHAHLRSARLGFLWTNVGNARGMHRVVGQCEFQPPNAIGKWQRARAEVQIEDWFGHVPDFLITLDATYAQECDDASFCSLVEHELYHAGQAKDLFGAPKFTKYGRPVFAMRGHDVEEFVGIVRRYGVGSAAGETSALVAAAKRAPEITEANVRHACGTCLKLAA